MLVAAALTPLFALLRENVLPTFSTLLSSLRMLCDNGSPTCQAVANDFIVALVDSDQYLERQIFVQICEKLLVAEKTCVCFSLCVILPCLVAFVRRTFSKQPVAVAVLFKNTGSPGAWNCWNHFSLDESLACPASGWRTSGLRWRGCARLFPKNVSINNHCI